MGFELGPKLLRRAPRGWLPARAFPLRHSVYDHPDPTWTLSGPMGAGNRWYKVRVRPTYGLMAGVGVPCFVDPSDRAQIWIDWDKAYEEHVPAWEREALVRRGVSNRDNPYDKVVGRIANPFAGKLRDGEEELVQARIAEQEARAAKYAPPPPDPAVQAQCIDIWIDKTGAICPGR